MFDELLDDEISQLETDEGPCIGIDLGTTNSVVAFSSGGPATAFRGENGSALNRSVVAWLPGGKRLVGAEAHARRVIDPPNTVYSAKRIIGQPFGSERVGAAAKQLPYRIVEGEQREPLIVTREGNLSVPQLSAYVLGDLRALAERELDGPVTHCLVTVPANFTDGQRAATRRAAELAGMDVLRILNEPTAAAVAYGRERPLHQRIAVFDMGGGTFDITLLAVRGNLYEVIATGGDMFLGGDDFDHLLAQRLSCQFLREHHYDPDQDPIAKSRLLAGAEQIKVHLSSELAVNGTLREIAYGVGGKELDLAFDVQRSEFEAVIAPIVDRAMATVASVLGDAGIQPLQVDEVILVGGSTRIPLIHERVASHFGQEPKCELDPMEVVALGAALQANALYGGSSTDAPVLFDVTPHSLRVGTVGGYSKTLIAKNSTIPVEGTKTFFTARDDQDAVHLKIFQGEEDRAEDNVPLGELVIEELSRGRRGEIAIDVAFTIDADGILQVSACDSKTGSVSRATLSAIGVKEQR